MSNSTIFIVLAVLLAALFGALLLGVFSKTEKPEPQFISLETAKLSLPIDAEVAAANLFESEIGTLGLVKISTLLPSHSHNLSHEVIYVINGHGSFQYGEKTEELFPGKMVIAFAGQSMLIQNLGEDELDLLVFLSPPSPEGDVKRELERTNLNLGQGILEPIFININEQLESLSPLIDSQVIVSRKMANFEFSAVSVQSFLAPGGGKATRDLILYAVNCSAKVVVGSEEFEFNFDEILILPDGSHYQISSFDHDRCDVVSYELESTSSN